MIETRELTPDDWRLWRELRLLALEESPEAFGSRLADWQGAGDAEARWRARLESVALNVVALEGDEAVGMVSGIDDGDQVELISMYVRASARGTGVADTLIDAVVAWARERAAERVWLSVRVANEPAKRLYRRRGFAEVGPAPRKRDEEPEILMAADLG